MSQPSPRSAVPATASSSGAGTVPGSTSCTVRAHGQQPLAGAPEGGAGEKDPADRLARTREGDDEPGGDAGEHRDRDPRLVGDRGRRRCRHLVLVAPAVRRKREKGTCHPGCAHRTRNIATPPTHVLTSRDQIRATAQRRARYRRSGAGAGSRHATHHTIQSRTGRSCRPAPSSAGQASSATPTTKPPTAEEPRRRTVATGPSVGAGRDGQGDRVCAEEDEAHHEGDDAEVVHQPRGIGVRTLLHAEHRHGAGGEARREGEDDVTAPASSP